MRRAQSEARVNCSSYHLVTALCGFPFNSNHTSCAYTLGTDVVCLIMSRTKNGRLVVLTRNEYK